MTREEAIEILQELWKYKETDKYTEAEIRQALNMAIKALEQEPIYYPPCQDCHTKVNEIVRAYNNVKSLDDAVSRQEAIHCVTETEMYNETFAEAKMRIAELKPVLPKRKKGEWIEVHPLQEDDGGAYMCSKCKCGHPYIAPHWKYCPNCGSRNGD